jgi:hypothetical protein
MSFTGPFFSAILDQHRPICTKLDNYVSARFFGSIWVIWNILDHFEPYWIILDHLGFFLDILDLIEPFVAIFDHFEVI